ncbi:MAG: hypothetical protein U1F23_01630 [Lysobacterales bacterium]
MPIAHWPHAGWRAPRARSGRLRDQPEGKLSGKFRGAQIGQRERLRGGVNRKPADQHGQCMAGLFHLLRQRRQRRLGLRKLRLLRRDVEFAGVTLRESQPQDAEQLSFGVDRLLRRIDLLLQRCQLHGGHDDVGTERRPRREHLEPRGFRLRGERLVRAALEARQIRCPGGARAAA